MALHIYAIGGSGARVVRSLLFLMAGGALRKETVNITLLDLDNKVKAFTDVETLSESYNSICSALNNYKSIIRSNFFSANLNASTDKGKLADHSAKTFKHFLIGTTDDNFQTNDDQNLDLLMKSLFSDKNGVADFKELHLPLSQGFIGNPNIGAVVMNSVMLDKEFETIINSIKNDDKVFIIGSIFGGTGAAGYPTLAKLIHTLNKSSNVTIGSLLLLPYFKLESGQNQQVQDDSWKAKTKAALAYYDKDEVIKKNIKYKYFIGDEHGRTYSYCVGGENQANPASVIEMMGAFSIIHFHQNTETDNKSYGYFAKAENNTPTDLTGVFGGDIEMDLRNFLPSNQNKQYVQLIKPLLRMSLLYLVRNLVTIKKDNYDNKNLFNPSSFFKRITPQDENIRDFWTNIELFCNSFKVWIDEMKATGVNITSGRIFNGLNLDINNYYFNKLFENITGINLDIENTLLTRLHNSPKNLNETNTLRSDEKLLLEIDGIINEWITSVTINTHQ